MSQSLWVRDRFLMQSPRCGGLPTIVAIPLGQGQVFNPNPGSDEAIEQGSQSLWVRDRFLIHCERNCYREESRNPFGSGTGF